MRNLAWAAGIFEGEGTVFTRVGTGSPILQINMTDLDVLESVRDILGGKIYGPYLRTNAFQKKPRWDWCQSGEEAHETVQRLLPYLGTRRQAQVAAVYEKIGATFAARKAPRPCRFCGTEFVPEKGKYSSRTFYCSDDCRWRYSYAKRRARVALARRTDS